MPVQVCRIPGGRIGQMDLRAGVPGRVARSSDGVRYRCPSSASAYPTMEVWVVSTRLQRSVRASGPRRPPVTRRSQRLAAIAAAGLVGLLAAACGSPATTPPIASVPGHGGSTATTLPLSKAQQIALEDQANVNFAHCMRSHGVNFPDPWHVAGHPGLTAEIPVRTNANRSAYNACIHYIAASAGAEGGPPPPPIAAAKLAALTNYARCMRAHDISMLDPDQYGYLNLGNVPGMTHDFGRYSPQFRSADTACRHLLPTGTQDKGLGP